MFVFVFDTHALLFWGFGRTGFALAAGTPVAMCFAATTALNIGPRAVQHHRYSEISLRFFLICFFQRFHNVFTHRLIYRRVQYASVEHGWIYI